VVVGAEFVLISVVLRLSRSEYIYTNTVPDRPPLSLEKLSPPRRESDK
jgi:hypothetical protein